MVTFMFKRYVKTLEDRIESLEAWNCSISQRLSQLDNDWPEDCPTCAELKKRFTEPSGLEITFEADPALTDAVELDDTARTVIDWAKKGFK